MAQQSAWAWPEAGAEAVARTVAKWPVTEAAGAIAVAGPCMWLAVARGGASTADQTPAYAAVFVLLAVWATTQCRRGIAVRLPLLCWFALVWPLAGLAPLPRMLLERLDPQRAAELAEFARAGIASPPASSLYPYATAHAFFVVAGSVALFTLARALGSRSTAALLWMAGAVLVMALAETLPALRQYAMLATGAAQSLAPGADFIRGTFGNRNLLAAWLEGCYGVALALFAEAVGQRRDGGPAVAGLGVLAGVTALASAVAILCSFSRMGAVALAFETVLVGWLRWRGGWRTRLAPAALVLGAVACMLAVGVPGLAKRYSAASLAVEKEGRLAMWADSLRAVRRYPVVGSGAGAFAFAFRRSHPYLTGYTIDHAHCEYLETAVEWGIPAAVLLAALAAAGLWRRVRAAKRAAGIRGAIGAGCLAGVCAVLLHGIVDFPLRIPAVLALVAALAGMAAAALPARREPAPAARWRSTSLAAGSAALAVLVALGLPKAWNAEAHYQRARRSFALGRFAEAAAADHRALEDCPYAAAAWSDLALAAEARGNRAAAIEASDHALAFEPHSRRIEWAVANLRLRLGDAAGALPLLGALGDHTPELRRPVWQICWDAGVPAAAILERTTSLGAGGLDEYLQYLVSQRRWEVAVDACTRSSQAGELRPQTLRAVFDGLFFAGQSEQALRLWKAIGGGGKFANGDLAGQLRGWGLDWAVRPAAGIAVERRRDERGYRLDIDFSQPKNIEYDGVTHDFAVIPGREYRLVLQAAAAGITSSSGVQVEVISPSRRLAASKPFHRSTPWTPVELRLRPLAGERICRLRVFRAAAASFDNRISGQFSLRRVSLEPLAPSAARRFSP